MPLGWANENEALLESWNSGPLLESANTSADTFSVSWINIQRSSGHKRIAHYFEDAQTINECAAIRERIICKCKKNEPGV